MEDGQNRRQVRVIDRRWLTPDGEPREGSIDAPPAAAEPAQISPTPAAESQAATAPPPVPAAVPSQILLDTVDFLAQYAMAFLTGQVAGVPRNPDAARLYIDLLGLVQERTRPYASLQEAKVLDDVLFQLRLQLVANSR